MQTARGGVASQVHQFEKERDVRRRWEKLTKMAHVVARMSGKNEKRRMPRQDEGEVLLYEDRDTQVFKKRTKQPLAFVMNNIRKRGV